MEIMDFQNQGIGDVVVACWIICSAKAMGERVVMNPRSCHELPPMLGIGDEHVTDRSGLPWAETEGLGHLYEFWKDRTEPSFEPRSRFHYWCQSLGLPRLAPIRPVYHPNKTDSAWAEEEWNKVDAEEIRPRVLVFPDTTSHIRQWPQSYFLELVAGLKRIGCSVGAMAVGADGVNYMDCHWWYGFSLSKVASMACKADVVIANDSGPAHLAGTYRR